MEQKRYIEEEQVSFKSLVDSLVWAKNSILKSYKLILLIVAISSIAGLLYDWYALKKPLYTARIVVNMETGGGSGGSSQLSGLASAFGFGSTGGGGSSSDMFSGDNFFQLLRTQTIGYKTLMKIVTIDGKKDLLVNHYIRRSGIQEDEWEDNDDAKKFRFSVKTLEKFNTTENGYMSQINERVNKYLLVEFLSQSSSFLMILVKTEDEQLSKALAETFLETLFEFYKEVTTSKISRTLKFAEQTADKYKSALYSTESALARFNDQNQQMIVQQGRISETRLNRNNSYLTTQYLQALTNVDNLRLALVRETPLYTVVEPIRMPLGIETTSIGKFAIRGFFIGLILSIIIILFRTTYLEAVKD